MARPEVTGRKVGSDPDERSYAIREFCLAEGISPARYYKMRKDGFGPEEMRFPGSSVVRISPDARRRWHEKIEKLSAAELKKDRAARAAQASKAGRKGAASPDHYCRRKSARA